MSGPQKAITAKPSVEALPSMGEALTPAQQKKFVELSQATDLDKRSRDEQNAILVAAGRAWGLKPEAGELMIYQGRLYVTIKGQRRNAHASELYSGLVPRPAPHATRKGSGYDAEDVVWTCDAYRKGADRPFVGWGCVRRSEIEDALKKAKENGRQPTPVATHPAEIAKKRAVYDALQQAFPLAEVFAPMHRELILEAEALSEQQARERKTALPLTEALDEEDELVEEAVVGHEAEGDLTKLVE